MTGRERTGLDWIRILMAVSAAFFVFLEGVGGRLKLCEDQALQSGDIVNVCRGPTASDLVVVAGGVLVLLLLAKEFQEIGLFGFALKSRVEQQEQRTGKLESSLALLNLKVETKASAVATTNVLLLTPDQVRDLLAETPEKGEEYFGELRRRRGDES